MFSVDEQGELIFHAERRDRETLNHKGEGGRVFILTKKDLNIERVTSLETDYEIMWIKMELYGTKLLYVDVYYHLK